MLGLEQSQALAVCTRQSLQQPRPPGPAGSSAENKHRTLMRHHKTFLMHLIITFILHSSTSKDLRTKLIIVTVDIFIHNFVPIELMNWCSRNKFNQTPTWPLWWYTSGLRVSISAAMLKSCVESRGCCCCIYMLPRLIRALARSCINKTKTVFKKIDYCFIRLLVQSSFANLCLEGGVVATDE